MSELKMGIRLWMSTEVGKSSIALVIHSVDSNESRPGGRSYQPSRVSLILIQSVDRTLGLFC